LGDTAVFQFRARADQAAGWFEAGLDGFRVFEGATEQATTGSYALQPYQGKAWLAEQQGARIRLGYRLPPFAPSTSLSLYDATGRALGRQQLSQVAGSFWWPAPLSPGLYLLVLHSEKERRFKIWVR